MNAQPIRWPAVRPRILLGGFNHEYGATRYFHLGPLVVTVERQFGRHAEFAVMLMGRHRHFRAVFR